MPTAEQAQEIEKRNRAGNPILWLKSMLDKAKLPEDVRLHINQLFKQHTVYKGIDPDVAYPIALKIAARVNWVRSQHALLTLDPLDKRYFTASKAASQWALNQAKSDKTQTVGRTPGDDRQQFPSTPENPNDDNPDSRTAD